tara:strand:+ start:262 stop:663 length:402 start_codon:yes stop_codon:yes gene_type:complete
MNRKSFKAVLYVVFASLLAGCVSQSKSNEQVAHMTTTHSIEFLYFDGCPNTPRLRETLELALNTTDQHFTPIDMTTLDENDLRRGYGSPTILVDNQDLFGAPAPKSGMMSCRIYPEGLPDDSQIIAKLNEVTQ